MVVPFTMIERVVDVCVVFVVVVVVVVLVVVVVVVVSQQTGSIFLMKSRHIRWKGESPVSSVLKSPPSTSL